MLAAIALAGIAGCGDPVPEPPAASSGSQWRPDAVDPSGLLEGPLDAFGLRFPLRSTVVRRTATSIVVDIPFMFEPVSNYMRARLKSDRIDIGPKSTVFNDARLVSGDGTATFHVILQRTAQTARVTMMRNTGPTEPSKDVRSEYSKMWDGGVPDIEKLRQEQMARPPEPSSPAPPPGPQ